MRKVFLISTIICILFPYISLSSEIIDSKLLICSKIKNDIIRKKCYSSIQNTLNVQEDNEYSLSSSNTYSYNDKNDWNITRDISKIDGTKSISYITESINELENSIGIGEHAYFILYYQDNEINAYIECPYALEKYADIIYRIDQNTPIKESWERGKDSSTIFSRKPLSFIKKISKGQKIIFRVKPRNRTSDEIEFHISGADKAFKELSMAVEAEKNDFF